MKEIGGYFQLENLHGAEYHRNLLRLNLGRTALLYALEALGVKKLYLPRFICDSVTSACEAWGGEIKWYSISPDFMPVCDAPLEKGGFLYLINYYGQLEDSRILTLQKKYGNLIVDNTHCFFRKPLPGIPTLCSCRKFFGLPDGAYLSLPHIPGDYDTLPADSSADRMVHILGRYEHSASDYYSFMLETAKSYYREPIKRMSPLTENLLRGIDYEETARRREENYMAVDKLLWKRLPDSPSFHMTEAPFVYPFYTKEAARLRRELAKQKIFVPCYWSNVIQQMPADSLEHDYAAHILPLPVDQRYTVSHMEHMASVLLELLQFTATL